MTNSSSPWTQGVNSTSSGVTNIEKFFLPGNMIRIERKDTTTGTLSSSNFEIVSAANVSATVATVIIKAPLSPAGWAAATKANYQPTCGNVTLLNNSVSDRESWGNQMPAVNNLGLITRWRQTYRRCHDLNDEYLNLLAEAEKGGTTSSWFRKFRTLPIAEIRRQQEEADQKMRLNTFFYNEPINEYQTEANWKNLPRVTSPQVGYDGSGALANIGNLEYKANSPGVAWQLNEAGRCWDKAGAALDLDAIFEAGYNICRNRKTSVFTILGGTLLKHNIKHQMIRYYKAEYLLDFQTLIQPNQKMVVGNGIEGTFTVDTYDIPKLGIQMEVVSHQYFDDRKRAFTAAQASVGNTAWIINWNDVAFNVLNVASAKRQTDLHDEAFRYVIQPYTTQTMLWSTTFEIEVGDVNRHLVINNFSDDPPKVTTVAGVDVPA